MAATAERVLSLQRSAGNQAVCRLIAERPASAGARPSLQRKLKLVWGGKREQILTSLEQLKAFGVKDSEFFESRNNESWKADKVPPRDAEKKAKWAAELYEDLGKLLKDAAYDKEVKWDTTIPGLRGVLIVAVKEYRRYQTEAAKAAERAKKEPANTQGKTVSTAGIPAEAAEFYQELVGSGRAFPLDDLKETAKKATLGAGYLYELEIAQRALAVHEDAYAMFGKHREAWIKDLIPVSKGSAALAPGERTHKEGGVGADVTIWYPVTGNGPAPSGAQDPAATRQFAAYFVQTKVVNKSSFADNAKAARNQLEGECADATRAHSSAEREVTMRGPGYRGIIFISVTDNLDWHEAKREAHSILRSSKWVDEFVVEWAGTSSGGAAQACWGKDQHGQPVELDRPTLLPRQVSE